MRGRFVGGLLVGYVDFLFLIFLGVGFLGCEYGFPARAIKRKRKERAELHAIYFFGRWLTLIMIEWRALPTSAI